MEKPWFELVATAGETKYVIDWKFDHWEGEGIVGVDDIEQVCCPGATAGVCVCTSRFGIGKGGRVKSMDIGAQEDMKATSDLQMETQTHQTRHEEKYKVYERIIPNIKTLCVVYYNPHGEERVSSLFWE